MREIHNLGYIAHGEILEKQSVLHLAIYVQGHVENPKKMDEMIEQFLKYLYDYVKTLPE